MLAHSRSSRCHFTRAKRSIRANLRCEALEERRLLASFSPLASAADGSPGSLRAAIIQANVNGQDNTIKLQAGTYHLTLANSAGQENAAARGDLDLTDAGHTVTIVGAGAGVTIIDGGGLDRVFQVLPGVTAKLSGLTIQNGAAKDAGNDGTPPAAQPGFGGGILNAGTVVLSNVVVQNCIAAGAAGTDGTPGDLTAAGGGGFSALGGGIYNAGTLTLAASTVANNTSEGGKGGNGAFSAVEGSGGDGGAGSGGGIYNIGSLTVTQSTISSNNAYGGFGGDGADNSSNPGYDGGSGGNAFGGGLDISQFARQTLIINSTIAGNTANGGAGGHGGAGGQGGNPLTNMGSGGGAGGNGGTAKGGGIAAESVVSLYNTTLAANQADGSDAGQGGPGGVGNPNGLPGKMGFTGPAFAGGIFAPSDPGTPGLLISASTIIAENTSAPDRLAGEPDDVEATFANVTTTLLGFGDGATGITGGAAGNLVGVDPNLGSLRNNGGPTLTMALLAGSPAIDAGSNPLGLTADQRGYTPRAAGAAADIGAVQSGATAPSSGNGGGGAPGQITVQLATVKGHREIRVVNPATGALKFAVYPFGKSYRGSFSVSERDVNGDHVPDVIVQRHVGRKKVVTVIYSGASGARLPSKLA